MVNEGEGDGSEENGRSFGFIIISHYFLIRV